MPMYLQKVYDAIMAVPRDPDVIVEVDQASLDSLMTMLRDKDITIELNTVNENTTAILTGTVIFTMKTFIKDIGFKWDSSNKQYTMDIDEEGKLQEVSNELSEMCREWAITFVDPQCESLTPHLLYQDTSTHYITYEWQSLYFVVLICSVLLYTLISFLKCERSELERASSRSATCRGVRIPPPTDSTYVPVHPLLLACS